MPRTGKITAYEYDKAGRLVKTLYTFGQGKEREDFAERMVMGLYPEEAKDKKHGPKLDLSAIAQYKFIDGFDKLEDDLTKCTDEHEDAFKAFNKNTNWPESWKWIPGEGATEFATRLSLGSTTSKTLTDAYAKISMDTDKRKNRFDTTQWMWTETFTYDPSNNRATKANGWGRIGYTYNEANQMLSSGNRNYQYDLNGNMTQEALGDAKVDYTYSLENRIVEIYTNTKGFTGKSGDTLEEGIEYSNDSFGRRNTRTEYSLMNKNDRNSRQWKKESNTSYMYDGLSLTVILELYDTNYTMQNAKNYNRDSMYSPMAKYVYAKGEIIIKTDFPDYKHFNGNWYGRNGQKTYYSQDVLGSTVLLTDSFGHNKMEYTYDSFGTAYQGTFASNNYGYTGKTYDTETGLYNYGFRDYIPGVGRWTSEDPVKAGRNWYEYCGNKPINLVDPLGLCDGKKEAGMIAPPGRNPKIPPGKNYEWKGQPGSQPGDPDGNWYNPETKEWLHPHLDHPEGIKPHWDYYPGKGKEVYRIDPDTGNPLPGKDGIKTRDYLPDDKGFGEEKYPEKKIEPGKEYYPQNITNPFIEEIQQHDIPELKPESVGPPVIIIIIIIILFAPVGA